MFKFVDGVEMFHLTIHSGYVCVYVRLLVIDTSLICLQYKDGNKEKIIYSIKLYLILNKYNYFIIYEYKCCKCE